MSEQTQTLTVAEAAKYFGRAERTIRHWCAIGTLIAAGNRVIRHQNTRWLIVIPKN
jgi:Helix-turn-helix domain